MVASTHWLASQTGMAVLERGGNAFDAAVGDGLRPPGRRAAPERPGRRGAGGVLVGSSAESRSLSADRASRPRPRRSSASTSSATSSIPGTGVLAACVPGAFGGWLLLLRDFGTWRLADVLEFAIGYAEHGYPLHERVRATIELNEDLVASWPGSRDLYLPLPRRARCSGTPRSRATYRRIVDESRGGSREEEIEKARLAYYEGFVADEIDRFAQPRAASSPARTWPRGSATIEPVVSSSTAASRSARRSRGRQARSGSSSSRCSQGFDLAELSTAEFVHVVVECGKLAFADRDALYGDSADVPLETLLSPGVQRRAARARRRGRVGRVRARGSGACRGSTRRRRPSAPASPAAAPCTSTSPTASGTSSRRRRAAAGSRARRSSRRSAGRSGRARRCSGSRRGSRRRSSPGSGRARRSAPGLALRDGEPYLAWGTPGGDQQEQWALHAFVRHVDLGHEPPGGDRRARVPHGPPDLVVLPARLRAEVACARVPVRLADGRRPSSAAGTTSPSGPRGRPVASPPSRASRTDSCARARTREACRATRSGVASRGDRALAHVHVGGSRSRSATRWPDARASSSCR